MAQKPVSIILQPNDRIISYLLARISLCTALSLFGAYRGISGAWYAVVLFGVPTLAILTGYMSHAGTLHLTEKGFEIYAPLGKKHFHAWDEIEHFQVKKVGVTEMASFTYNSKRKTTRGSKIMRKIMGGIEGVLPKIDGKNPTELVEFMNGWKESLKFNP